MRRQNTGEDAHEYTDSRNVDEGLQSLHGFYSTAAIARSLIRADCSCILAAISPSCSMPPLKVVSVYQGLPVLG